MASKAMNLTSSGTFKMTLSWVVEAKAALVSQMKSFSFLV
jgi:hypothetical protein